MTRRAAAGAVSVSVWSDEDIGIPLPVVAPVIARSTIRNNKHQILGYERTSRTLIAFSVFAMLSLVSYATYAHQWAELSALRHLGQTSPDK